MRFTFLWLAAYHREAAIGRSDNQEKSEALRLG